ncbi:MAG TPA: hypothetical protein VH933_02230 [Aestuariivirgaceae bacterium]|jgi:hypothetical protein
MSELQQAIWRPSFPDTPRLLRIIPVSGIDAIEWTMVGVRCVSEPNQQDFAKGTELGMNLIKGELLLPLGRELTVQELLSCFTVATANRRATKLSRILYLVHTYPGVPMLHRGLRFVTATLWASYAALGLEGEDGRLQSARINSTADVVWATLGWKIAVS